jgi:tricorn protease-like protein
LRSLTKPPPGTFGDCSPALSPDGKTLAFVRVIGPITSDLYIQTAAGGEARRLTYRVQEKELFENAEK